MVSIAKDKDLIKACKEHFSKDPVVLKQIEFVLTPYQKQERDCTDGPRSLGTKLELIDDFHSYKFLHTFKRKYVLRKDSETLGSDTSDDDETLEKRRVAENEKNAEKQKLEDLAAEQKSEDPAAEQKSEELVAQQNLEQPAADKDSEQPVVEQNSEQLAAEPKSEEDRMVANLKKSYKADRDQSTSKWRFLILAQVMIITYLGVETFTASYMTAEFKVSPESSGTVITRFLCAVFLHIILIDEIKQGFQKMKYANNHWWKFSCWWRAYFTGFCQMFIVV